MTKKNGSDIQYMNKEALQQEFITIAKEVERLSKQLDITTDEEEDVFNEHATYCVETLQRLRNRTNMLYYDKLLNK